MAQYIIQIDAAAWAAARHDYEFTTKSARQIADEVGLKRRTFQDRVKAEGWVRRMKPVPRPPGHRAKDAPRSAAATPETMAEQIACTIERQLSAIDVLLRQLGAGDERTAEAERVARTLASLTRTLSAVQKMRAPDGAGAPAQDENADDRLPRDIDEFRRELARRIDAFVEGRADAALPDDGKPPGA